MDHVKMDRVQIGFQIPSLAFLSWRYAGKSLEHLHLQIVQSAAVLDLSGSDVLERLPPNLQVCPSTAISLPRLASAV